MTYYVNRSIFSLPPIDFKMENSYDEKLSQARGLASQLGMFAEENDIPKDLWDELENTIYSFYEISNDR